MIVEIGGKKTNTNCKVKVKFTDNKEIIYDPKETDVIYLNMDYVISIETLKE